MRYQHPHGVEDAIAVVSADCYFPGASGLEAYWELLQNGKSGIETVDANRTIDDNFVNVRSCLENPKAFDHDFFGLSPAEAALLDPQHRYLLELCQSVFERASLKPEEVDGYVGVFVGVGLQSYLMQNILTRPDLKERYTEQQIFFGNDKGFSGARLAHAFDFKGPCIGVDTACSTSLVAVYAAIQALRNGECDLAVAGGSSLNLFVSDGYHWSEGGVSSRTGLCRPFSDDADGTVFGSGAGLVLLKRAEDAIADGDPILAFVLNAACNNDGAQKSSFAAPSTRGQMNVIADCLEGASVSAQSVGYVEAHGTGTHIGDPIEFDALSRIFNHYEAAPNSCGLGSVKSNFGHLDVAAGIAGLLKTVLALHHRQIPPSLHIDQPNAELDLAQSPFYLVDKLRDWPDVVGHPQRASVSSFGIGGTNAHVLLEAAVEVADENKQVTHTDGPVILPISAGSDDGVRTMAGRIAASINGQDPLSFAQALHRGRTPRSRRKAVVIPDTSLMQEVLVEVARGEGGSSTKALLAPRLAFLFPGQGGLGNLADGQLYRQAPEFRAVFNECMTAFGHHLGLDLTAALNADMSALDLTDTRINQAWTFAHSLAAHKVLKTRGLTPDIMIGHSLGELSAFCAAGAISLGAAVQLIATRGALMARLEPGVMAAVGMQEAALTAHLLEGIDIASVNGPTSCVVSGREEAVAQLEETLRTQEDTPVFVRRLKVTRAFHSHLVDPILDAWREAVSSVQFEAIKVPVVSNLDGCVLPVGFVPDSDYMAALVRQPVRFLAGLETLVDQSPTVALEVGSGTVLSGFAQRAGFEGLVATSLTSERSTDADPASLAMARLWEMGCDVDGLTPSVPDGYWRRPAVPPTPFERTEHWIEAGFQSVATSHPLQSTDAWQIQSQKLQTAADEATKVRLLQRSDVLVALAPLGDVRHDIVFSGAALQEAGAERDRFYALCNQQERARLIFWTDGQDPNTVALIRSLMQGLALTEGDGPESVFILGPGELHLEYAVNVLSQTWSRTQMVRGICPPNPEVLAEQINPTFRAQVWHARKGWLHWCPSDPSEKVTQSTPTIIIGQGELAQAAQEKWPDIQKMDVPAGKIQTKLPVAGRPATTVSLRSDMAQSAQALDGLAIGYVWTAFGEDLTRHLGEGSRDSASLSAAIGVDAPFLRFFEQLLDALVDRGNLARNGALFLLPTVPSKPTDLEDLQRTASHEIDGFDSVLSLLDRCGRNLKRALTGKVSGASVIFENGALEETDRAFKQILGASNFSETVDSLANWLSLQRVRMHGRRIRVLEVGAGKGELTWRIGPVLNALGCKWHFTDIGPTFVRQARETSERFGIDYMTFDQADISHLPDAVSGTEYDLILGFDVVHATPDLERSLRGLKDRLAPGGALALIEATRPALWNDLIWGMTPEWWSFTDTDRRESSPLISPAIWEDVNKEVGFEVVKVTKQTGITGDDTYALIIASTAESGAQPVPEISPDLSCLKASDHVLVDLTSSGGAAPTPYEIETYMRLAEDVALTSLATIKIVTDDHATSSTLRDIGGNSVGSVTVVKVDGRPVAWDNALTQIASVPAQTGLVSLTRKVETDKQDVASALSDRDKMLDLWQQVFGDATLRHDQDFHDLGGDSLVAAQLVSWVRNRFGIDISIEMLFAHPTPAMLAQYVQKSETSGSVPLPVLRRWAGQGDIPLSETQKTLWFSTMLQEDRAIYNIPGAIRLTGALDYPALTEALKTLLATHDLLRLRISEVDGNPVARLADEIEIDLTPHDVAEAELTQTANAFGKDCFDFNQQMFTARLLRLAPNDHVLLVNMHHIVSDGWSLGLMVQEIIKIYDQRLRSETTIPVPAWRYVDFVDWEQRALTDDVIAAELAFWRNYLDGAPVISPLLEHAGTTGAVGAIQSDVFHFTLEPELSAEVLKAAEKNRMTPFMFLLAGLNFLISRRTGASDIVVGTTLANRYLPEFEGIIGPFVNNVAIRNRLDAADNIEASLNGVKASVLEAFAHGLLPFHRVVRDAGHARSENVAPIIQILFVLQNLEVNLSLPELETRQLDMDDVFTKFSLSLFMEHRDTGLIGNVVFDAGVFSATEITALIADFKDLLRTLVAAEPEALLFDTICPPKTTVSRPNFSRRRLLTN